jgi:hypothetical protein
VKIPATQLLKVEDFKDQKGWISPMFYILNRFISSCIAAVNGDLQFGENITGMEHVFDFTFQSTAATFPQQFKWTINRRPNAFQIVSAEEDGESVILLAVLEYTAEGFIRMTSAVIIDTVAPGLVALNAGSRYVVRVRVSP